MVQAQKKLFEKTAETQKKLIIHLKQLLTSRDHCYDLMAGPADTLIIAKQYFNITSHSSTLPEYCLSAKKFKFYKALQIEEH